MSFLCFLAGTIVLFINPDSIWNKYIFFLLVGCSVAVFLYSMGIGRYGTSKKDRKEEVHSG